MKTLISIIFFMLFFNNTRIIGMDLISNPPNDTAYYCFITDVFSEGSENYIQIRPIQFLWGLNAVIEAKKDGSADFIIDNESKDTAWFVVNDYYIIASEKTEFKFMISDNVKVTVYDNAVQKKITINELLNKPSWYKLQLYDKYSHEEKAGMDYYIYEIAVENGNVTIIQEIYVP